MDDTVMLAEQATLGALLLDPPAIAGVQRWLRASDFTDWWHGQVWTALHERHTAGQPIGVEALGQAMVDRLGHRAGGRLRLLDLVHLTPPHPAPAVYARMVTEAGLRREVAGQGVLLRAGALQSALCESAGPLALACLSVDATLDSIARRWADATGTPRPATATPIPLRPTMPARDLRTGADKYLASHPPRDPAGEHAHLVALIGTLIAHPHALPGVAAWLRPTQVPDPGWRAVYTAATDLAERGEPVDVVTVAWAVRPMAHHGVQVPDVPHLRQVVDDGWLDHPARAARVVAGEQLCALADKASTQLLQGADNPAVDVAELVDTGYVLTNALRHAATGLPTTVPGARGPLTPPPDATRGPVTR